jgi:hypothetical protein
MIDFLRRKTAKRGLITITGTDPRGKVIVEQAEIVTYPWFVRWILPTKVYLEVKGNIEHIKKGEV